MSNRFAERMNHVHESFVREILKATENPEIISFAGGLPSPDSFPVKEIEKAACKVLSEQGARALQYATTEGDIALRKFIANRYKTKHGLDISPDNIIITTGSQQALDLIGKVFLDEGDSVIIECPGYLGAIQSLAMYMPKFISVPLNDDGIDIKELDDVLKTNSPKLFYTVTNFNNPMGTTYTLENKKEIAKRLKGTDTYIIEDNPYGELRFSGEDVPLMPSVLDDNVILLGSFSKVVAPAMRLGWIYANNEVIQKLTIALQASTLHTNSFAQKLVAQYLIDNDLDNHIAKIKEMYSHKRNLMVRELEKELPPEVKFTRPEGGMFLWVTLPENISSRKVFEVAFKNNVIFVPGDPFYVETGDTNTMRLNYTNSSDEQIVEGVKCLANAIKQVIEI